MIKELAALIGVSEDTVINWEKRGIQPTRKGIAALQAVLGISLPSSPESSK